MITRFSRGTQGPGQSALRRRGAPQAGKGAAASTRRRPRGAGGRGARAAGVWGLRACTGRQRLQGPDARPGGPAGIGASARTPVGGAGRGGRGGSAGPHARDDVVQRPVDDVPDPGHVGLGDALQAHAEVGVPGVAVVPGTQTQVTCGRAGSRHAHTERFRPRSAAPQGGSSGARCGRRALEPVRTAPGGPGAGAALPQQLKT